MRPRPFDRGEPEVDRTAGTRRRTSMQPRPFDRGEPKPRPAATPALGDFNAATAIPPWRTWKAPPASSSGNHTSMRPRPFDRGEPVAVGRLRPPQKNFNAAT